MPKVKDTFVVYHVSSTQLDRTYSTEHHARARARKNNERIGATAYAYTTREDYLQNVVYTKKVRNLMSGKEIEIPSNTPGCCDPSTETYWSM